MSRKRPRRIFGMTSSQLGILMVLSLIAIGIIFGGFILISNSSRPSGLAASQNPAPANSSESGSTPDLTDITSLSLTATLNPSEVQIPPDWKQFGNSRIEVRVPPQFNSVDTAIQRQARIDFLNQQGDPFLASQLESEIFDYRYWFNFSQPDTVPFVTSIAVKVDFLPTETLPEYVSQTYNVSVQGAEFVNAQDYPIEGLEAQRVLMIVKLNDMSLGVAEDVITDGINLWIISCWSDFNEFYTWLPVFDKVARSFRLLN